MTADLLREAASLMRERAEAATPGPWTCYGDHLVWPSDKGPAANDPILAMGDAHEESTAHVAGMHPAVALAVADWLDEEWAQVDLFGAEHPEPRCECSAHTVARAYLGRES